ncbi:MAG TPA: hypothetical protein V6D27_15100 [Vampirovibrionales bacterium]
MKIDALLRSRVLDHCETLPVTHNPQQSGLATATSTDTLGKI